MQHSEKTNGRLTYYLQLLGPGLLFAGAAVGVSHLVQSTRAGADYGFALVWAVVLANILKYPFFQFGPRYAAATGESLIDGYKKQGSLVLAIFVLVTLGTMFTVQAAVTIVTAALLTNILGFGDPLSWSIVLLISCSVLLAIGQYRLLDSLIKVVIVILTVSTIIALFAVMTRENQFSTVLANSTFLWTQKEVLFLIALMGWMPAPIDISVWHSLWTLEKKKITTGSGVKSTLFDFNVGYIGTAILALCFLSLGALVMYGSGEPFSGSAATFAGQLIKLYTTSLGEAAWVIIAIAALTTMFSTTITCLDAYPRVMSRTVIAVFPQYELKHAKKLYWVFISITIIGALIILKSFSGSLKSLVDLATILSFLTAPVLAFMNYRLVTSSFMPDEHKPGMILRIWSFLGMVFLLGFCVLFLRSFM